MESSTVAQGVDRTVLIAPAGEPAGEPPNAPDAESAGETIGASPAALESAPLTKPEAMRALRQSRLRAATAFLFGWFVLISGQAWAVDLPWSVPAVVAVGLGATLGTLLVWKSMPPRWLRAAEWTTFAMPALAFVVFQSRFMEAALSAEHQVGVELVVKNGLINAATLLLAYAVLIPNRVREAAPLIVLLAVYPEATTWTVLLRHGSVAEFVADRQTYEPVGLNATMALVLGGVSLYGIGVLHVLREDAFEARRLNQYRLGRKLGEGGMGVVYAAEHKLLKRPCALKMVRPGRVPTRRAIARLEREVRLTARISHPNIVEIYDYGRTDDGAFYYVMERLRGASLRTLVRENGPLPAARAIYLLRQVCEGLAEAHAVGLTHRDLTPSNLYAARVGRRCDVAKILDFGLARPAGERRSARAAIAGTPQYMAPETVARPAAIDRPADLYSLGAVAYFLVTGRPPFAGRGVADTLSAHAREPVTPPSRHSDVPPDLERLILRCLEKEPAERFPDADALGAALGRCAAADDWGPNEARAWWAERDAVGANDPQAFAAAKAAS